MQTEEDILRGLVDSDVKAKMSMFFNSIEYAGTVKQLNQNNARFEELPESYKLTVLYMNSIGLDTALKDMHRFLYRTPPPTIEQYLTPEHGGPFVDKMYPKWKHVLLRDFGSSFKRSIPNEIVVTGAIGTGKTSLIRFLLLWKLIRMCCLLNPQSTLNVTQETLLVLALFTVTLDKASLALIKPFISLLDQSPYFKAVAKLSDFGDFVGAPVTPFLVRQKYIEFPQNIIINLGSTVEHAISYSMFGALLDEAEFRGGVERSFAVYTNLRERVRSRFLGSSYTLTALVSSSKYTQGIIADYIRNTSPDDPLTKIYSFAIWDIKHFNLYEDEDYFYVLVGNSSNPHRILEEHEAEAYEADSFLIPPKCQIIKVPGVYRKDFQNRMAEALQNLAGIAVLHTSTFIFSTPIIQSKYLPPEVKIQVDLGAGHILANLVPQSAFDTVFDNKRFRIAPDAPRYIHLDLAETAIAGVSVCHPEMDYSGRVMYIMDFTLEIFSHTRIDITAIRDFIMFLSTICYLRAVTADQFQSSLLRQELTLERVADKIELLSVDRTTEPYETVARIVQNGQLIAGVCPTLQKQWDNIQVDDSKSAQKIHTGGVSRKDLSDSVVGCVYSAVSDFNKTVSYYIEDWINGPKPIIKEDVMEGFSKL